VNRTGKIIVVVALVLVAFSAYTAIGHRVSILPKSMTSKKKITDDFTAKGMTVAEVSMLPPRACGLPAM
jgi:hypothetical protein